MFSNRNTLVDKGGDVAAVLIDDDEEREKLQSLNDWQQISLKNTNSRRSNNSGAVALTNGIQESCSDSLNKKKSKKKWVQLPLVDIPTGSSDRRHPHVQRNQCYAVNAWKGKKGSELFTKKTDSLESVTSRSTENSIVNETEKHSVSADNDNIKHVNFNRNKNGNSNIDVDEDELLKKALRESLKTAKEEEGRRAMLIGFAVMSEDELLFDSDALINKDDCIIDCEHTNCNKKNVLPLNSNNHISDNNNDNSSIQKINSQPANIKILSKNQQRSVVCNNTIVHNKTNVHREDDNKQSSPNFCNDKNNCKRNGNNMCNFTNSNKNGMFNGRTNGFVNRNRRYGDRKKVGGHNKEIKEENYKYIFKNKSRCNNNNNNGNGKYNDLPASNYKIHKRTSPDITSEVNLNNSDVISSNDQHNSITNLSDNVLTTLNISGTNNIRNTSSCIVNSFNEQTVLNGCINNSNDNSKNSFDNPNKCLFINDKHHEVCSNNNNNNNKTDILTGNVKNSSVEINKESVIVGRTINDGVLQNTDVVTSLNMKKDDSLKLVNGNVQMFTNSSISFLNDSEILLDNTNDEINNIKCDFNRISLPSSSLTSSTIPFGITTTTAGTTNTITNNDINSVWYPVTSQNNVNSQVYTDYNYDANQFYRNVNNNYEENLQSDVVKLANNNNNNNNNVVSSEFVGEFNVNMVQTQSLAHVNDSLQFDRIEPKNNFNMTELNTSSDNFNNTNDLNPNMSSIELNTLTNNSLRPELNFNCNNELPNIPNDTAYNISSNNMDSFRNVVYNMLKSEENVIVNNIVSKIITDKITTNQSLLKQNITNVQAPPGFTTSVPQLQRENSSSSILPDYNNISVNYNKVASNQSSDQFVHCQQQQFIVPQMVSFVNNDLQQPVHQFLPHRIKEFIPQRSIHNNTEMKEPVLNDTKKDNNISDYQQSTQVYSLPSLNQSHMLQLPPHILPISHLQGHPSQLQQFHRIQHLPLNQIQQQMVTQHPHRIINSSITQLPIPVSETLQQTSSSLLPTVQIIQQNNSKISSTIDNNQQRQCSSVTMNRNVDNDGQMRHIPLNYGYNPYRVNGIHNNPYQITPTDNKENIENNYVVSVNTNDIDESDSNGVTEVNNEMYHNGNGINNHYLFVQSNYNSSNIVENNFITTSNVNNGNCSITGVLPTNQISQPQILIEKSYNDCINEGINDVTNCVQNNFSFQQQDINQPSSLSSSSSSVTKSNDNLVMINSSSVNDQQRSFSGSMIFTNNNNNNNTPFIPGQFINNSSITNLPIQQQSTVLQNQQPHFVYMNNIHHHQQQQQQQPAQNSIQLINQLVLQRGSISRGRGRLNL